MCIRDRLLEAVVAGPSHWHLVVVGGSPEMVRGLRDSGPGRSLGRRLHTPGTVADPRPYLRAGDVFAFPSAYEAFSLAVIEAMACGLPVVGTATGSVPDVVREGSSGFVVDRDVGTIRAALHRVDEGDRPAMRAAARATALEHTWESVAIEYLRLFDRVSPVPGGWGPG